MSAVSLSALVGCSSTSQPSAYVQANNVGLQAYTYGLPLLLTNATFEPVVTT